MLLMCPKCKSEQTYTIEHPNDVCFCTCGFYFRAHQADKTYNLTKQIDGDHYTKMGIQPWEIIQKNQLDYWEGNALKYLLRWRKKDGVTDLDKVIHYCEHMKTLAKQGHYGDVKDDH